MGCPFLTTIKLIMVAFFCFIAITSFYYQKLASKKNPNVSTKKDKEPEEIIEKKEENELTNAPFMQEN